MNRRSKKKIAKRAYALLERRLIGDGMNESDWYITDVITNSGNNEGVWIAVNVFIPYKRTLHIRRRKQ